MLSMNRHFGKASVAAVLAALFLLLPIGLAAQNKPPEKAGFPFTITGGGQLRSGHPALADLGLTPGHKSIVFGTDADLLFVVLYNGTVAPGFPVTLPAESSGSPAVANVVVGSATIPLIFISYGSTFQSGHPGGMRAYKVDGTLLWDRPSTTFDSTNGLPDVTITAPAVGAIDGTGLMQVAWGSTDNNIYLVDAATGVNLPGWPVAVRDSIRSSAALHDIDGDGRPDIIIGVDAHLEGPPYNTPNGGCLHVLRYDATEVTGFPQCIAQTITSSPAVGDINGDGAPEIVVGTGTFYSGGPHQVYAFKCNGTQAAGWPVSVDGQVPGAPALADINGDGNPEVIVSDDNSGPSGTYHVYAFTGSGTQLWKTQPVSYYGTTPDAGEPVVADAAPNHTGLVVLVPVNSELVVLSATGQQLTDNGTHFAGAFSFLMEATVVSGEVDNLEAGGGTDPVEVVAVSFTGANSIVHAFNPKVSTNIPWGTFHQNVMRTGEVPGTPSCGASSGAQFFTLPPCRVIDTRNANGPYGGPPIAAQSSRTFTLAGQCGIPTSAISVSANITVVSPASGGDLKAYPGSGPATLTSVLNFLTGQTRANNLIILLGGGACTIEADLSTGTAQVVLDVNGYFQ
jgi:FG-GAP-like repeat